MEVEGGWGKATLQSPFSFKSSYGTQEEGCTNHSFIHSFKLSQVISTDL
jgi:hypothetical protein